jgi:hypothetical protein
MASARTWSELTAASGPAASTTIIGILPPITSVIAWVGHAQYLDGRDPAEVLPDDLRTGIGRAVVKAGGRGFSLLAAT